MYMHVYMHMYMYMHVLTKIVTCIAIILGGGGGRGLINYCKSCRLTVSEFHVRSPDSLSYMGLGARARASDIMIT